VSDPVAACAERLAAAARGGRVEGSGFLDEATSAACLARLRRDGVAASAWGGRPAAQRRVVVARPEHVPEAGPSLGALYFEGVHDGDEARAALRATGAPGEALGDAVPHRDGLSVIVRADTAEGWSGEVRIAGRPLRPEPVPLDRVATGSVKTLQLVVPSLRADVLGAKAFGASRSWFGKGVAAGKVRVDGAPAGKSAALEPGAELWAEGLGRARLLAVEGETKRGNRKVRVEVEKP
jgi:RNA-binding protein YlmH